MKVFHFDFRLIDIKILKFDIELAVRMRVCIQQMVPYSFVWVLFLRFE